ncbi:unnamed protein product [Cyprideis torosa]|uniref:1-(5-phosphoribosyl)-5-[(5-phosphoribosylamino)methylideneamino]imidazole-4-carboxamideisomerase n=1 Tax=Cyprideis torosa TaxID=163714 RepID=A0A7R8ZX47_9CRUS|nr:unnamed protein product [Cyprideis torosa]CAG0906521.1 unnamed protein product [Cyprideis torosa]
MLGPGNEQAAMEALSAWPGNLQVGGGIDRENCKRWLERGASHVIVTSAVFTGGIVNFKALAELIQTIGREHLVLDLSCRKRDGEYVVVTDRWQNFTDVVVSPQSLEMFSLSCAEFLVHAADVEGKCEGIEEPLVELLGKYSPIPTTYAGGIRGVGDIRCIQELGGGRIDFTVGSALDIFGGDGLRYEEVARSFNPS